MDDFPSNSQQPKRSIREEVADKAEPKRVTRVVEGEVVRRKKPIGKRMKEALLGGDSRSVGEYVFLDILIPGIRDIISDVATTSIERMVYGEARPGHGHRRPSQRVSGGGIGHTRYDRYSNGSPVGRAAGRDEPRGGMSRRGRATHDFDEFILPTRHEAQEVLSQMFEILETYEEVTVAQLYELVGESSNFTDHKWGWTDLRGSDITRTRSGYLLDLPRPEVLKD